MFITAHTKRLPPKKVLRTSKFPKAPVKKVLGMNTEQGNSQTADGNTGIQI